MDDLSLRLLYSLPIPSGVMALPETLEEQECVIYNDFIFAIWVWGVAGDGTRYPTSDSWLGPRQKTASFKNPVGGIWAFTSVDTGGFIATLTVVKGKREYIVRESLLTLPNSIGKFPEPIARRLLPQDSPRVIVGSGFTPLPSRYNILREQYWHRTNESVVLAPGESKTLSWTQKSGMQSTTSKEDEIAKNFGVSVSAGWGPIGASVSAGLNTRSRSFQEYAITEERTKYQSVTLSNGTMSVQMWLRWALTDVLTIFHATGREPPPKTVSTIVMEQTPQVVGGPYDPNTLAELEAGGELPRVSETPIG